MKQYGVLLIVVVVILLVLPLPALKITKSPAPPATSVAGSTQATKSASPDSDAKKVFKALDKESGRIYTLSEKDFLIYTVAAEMFPSYHSEALKAQAVASYTYYTAEKNRNQSSPPADLKGADFSDLPGGFPTYYSTEGLKKKWGSQFDTYYNKIKDAVEAVYPKMMVYKGEPIVAAYHALDSGKTESAKAVWGGSYDYLQSVPSPGDLLSPDYESTVKVSKSDFQSGLKKVNSKVEFSGNPADWITEKPVNSDGGSVATQKIGNTTFTGQELRAAFSLRSACFTIAYKDNEFIFTVKGYGHGVGMSQYGADYLARQNAGWEEILHYYYQDVQIQ